MIRRAGRTATHGFTLIELLIVMAIIGTLLSIAVPRYFRSLQHARETVLKQDLSILREAIDKYYADLNQYPEKLPDLVDKHYDPRHTKRRARHRLQWNAGRQLVRPCAGRWACSAATPTSDYSSAW